MSSELIRVGASSAIARQKHLIQYWKVVLAIAGVATWLAVSGDWVKAQTPTSPDRLLESAIAANESSEAGNDEPNAESAFVTDAIQQANDRATQAQQLTQTATTAAQWDAVSAQWMSAIALLQSIPPESPSRIFAQRQIHSYLQQLQDAQQRAEQSSQTTSLPTLGSDLRDAQMAGYLSYVASVGTPDILIVGSSRALQGIDPQVLQQTLAAQGYENPSVFNFSVNGATAQVVEFMLSELLPEPLPKVIVWGDGSRAFNEGRRDRTWESLRASPGYQKLTTGSEAERLVFNGTNRRVTARSALTPIPGNIDALGFSAVRDRFDPQRYYQQIPRVEGRYDGAYAGFALNGDQTAALGRLAAKVKLKESRLLFVNLPLSGSYLDSFRLYYEQQFQQFLQTQSAASDFAVIDLLTQWENQPGFFADPSHINQDGAQAIAIQLAKSPALIEALKLSAIESIEQPLRRPPPPIPPPPTLPTEDSTHRI